MCIVSDCARQEDEEMLVTRFFFVLEGRQRGVNNTDLAKELSDQMAAVARTRKV